MLAADELSALSQYLPRAPFQSSPRQACQTGAEDVLINSTSVGADDYFSKFPLYFRIYSWWILVQSWATLRFDDHRGINPKHIKVTSSSFTALLNRSKTIGDDKSIHSRPLIIDSACYLHSKELMQTGWGLLSDSANFERDFLLPAPSTNYHGVVRSELRCAIAYAMQNRVLSSFSLDGSRIFIYPVTHYWTPHSSRSYLPSATLLLDFPKVQRDFLGGWNAQASDRYARTACRSSQICKGQLSAHCTRKSRTPR